MTRVAYRIVAMALLATLIAPLHAGAQASLAALFEQGNAACFAGDYATAIGRYEALIASGIDDADVHYNLGTAYARAGQCGRAILAFERSMRLDAGDGDAERNLGICQQRLGKQRAQRDGEATVETRPPWSDALLRSVSVDALAGTLLVVVTLFFGALTLRRLSRRDTVVLTLTVSAWLLGLALLLAGAALGTKAGWWRQGEPAIVLREGATLREGPDPRAQTRGVALEGERARVVAREGEFVRVLLVRGIEGWLPVADVGVL